MEIKLIYVVGYSIYGLSKLHRNWSQIITIDRQEKNLLLSTLLVWK